MDNLNILIGRVILTKIWLTSMKELLDEIKVCTSDNQEQEIKVENDD